jgi:hypothetical protein
MHQPWMSAGLRGCASHSWINKSSNSCPPSIRCILIDSNSSRADSNRSKGNAESICLQNNWCNSPLETEIMSILIKSSSAIKEDSWKQVSLGMSDSVQSHLISSTESCSSGQVISPTMEFGFSCVIFNLGPANMAKNISKKSLRLAFIISLCTTSEVSCKPERKKIIGACIILFEFLPAGLSTSPLGSSRPFNINRVKYRRTLLKYFLPPGQAPFSDHYYLRKTEFGLSIAFSWFQKRFFAAFSQEQVWLLSLMKIVP